MPMVITDPRQHDNPIVFVNDAFVRLTGYSREETLGRNCRFLQGPGSNKQDVDRIRKAISDRVPVEIDLLNYRKDGTLFWNRLLISPVFDGEQLTYFFASQFDVSRERSAGYKGERDELETQMQQRIADLTASEERLHFTLKAGGFGIWTLDVPVNRLVVSTICKANFGRGAADTFSYEDLQQSIHPEDLPRWQTTIASALSGAGDFHVECRVIWPDHSVHWVEIRAETRFDADSAPLLMSGVSIDITARREAEAYRELMNREMSHRIKNILATVQSIVSQSLRTDHPASAMREVVSQRIQALDASHDVLTGKEWDVAGLRQTIARAIKPFNGGARIDFAGPDLEISHRASSALTMALHELATNAVKYGALSNDHGRVNVEWWTQDAMFKLRWKETGGPNVTPPTTTGFGSRLIERALSGTLGGTAKIDYLPHGIQFNLSTDLHAVMQGELNA